MCNCAIHNPIQCIIPPHMLRVLELRGDAKVAAMARALMKQDVVFREERASQPGAEISFDTTTPSSAFLTPELARKTRKKHLDRAVYDGQTKTGLPGKLLRSEGQPACGDMAADEAYDGAGNVYDLYFSKFGRDSLDGKGMKLNATVHHRSGYNNAFWNGLQMVYGDGDGQIFRKFTELSVIGHEMSHGVVHNSGGLIYQGQSGALNESFADVFGAMTVQRTLNHHVYEADWLIGKGILGPNIRGVALRSMKMPGTAYSDAILGQDPQPYHMRYYVNTPEDNGGVHINSGIPNHAFYLYCMYSGGNSWGAPGQIWYHALQRLNNPLATFHDWAAQTIASAMELYSVGSGEVNSLRRAWTLVGLSV